ncbi:MAG: YdcF family protein [Cyanosarcina radialis HA8281-LM2]|jgi:uncharacterized SAM-binding protein YcdF (DUF218 family)|nr:YdcF family protein [Cyanosarcina radialis HA8281-LM2]
MFLFLSKLLPVFFYPLGLACVLIILTLVLMKKRSRWRSIPIIVALVVLLVGSNGWVTSWLVRSLEWQNIPAAELPTLDAIVVLGGATKSAFPPRPSVDLNEDGDRLIYAAQLYREGKAPIVIPSGGRIDWLGGGSPEAADMAEILQVLGVPLSAIILEPDSLNTHENAVNVQKILAERGIDRVLLVTSAMHMPRSLAIFQHQKIDAIAAPTNFLVTGQDLAALNTSFGSVLLNFLPDSDRLNQTTRALKEYLGIALYRLRGWL